MSASERDFTPSQQQQLIAAFEQLALLIDSGLPLRAALFVVHSQLSSATIQQCFATFIATVDDGLPLHKAANHLPRRLPAAMFGYLQLAEQSGQFATVLQHMVQDYQQRQQQRRLLLQAIRYPAAIFAVAIVVTVVLLVWVLPQFTALFQTQQLPMLTQALLQLSALMQQHGLTMLAVSVSTVLLFSAIRRYHPQLWQRLLLRLPIVGPLLRLARTQQLFAQLSLLLRAGMAATAALQLVAASSPWFRTRADCGAIGSAIEQGKSWSIAIAEQRLDNTLINAYLKTGEQTGRIDDMMTRLAAELGRRFAHQCAQRLGLIQPLLMLSLGGIIGTLLLAMYLPIFNIGQQF
ncbi:hypothetical protein C5610_01810 [Idiomarina sp. OT37-5b]|jgi:type II secretory pathway component PulF|uniref:Type II secretion system protein GspF domain-containing protein n=1 Tax=Idiomarina aquatica TaxID=1327752 RepID=A0AA94EH00_9GAMM|nr:MULTISPECIES: type II secretion system F family protein [Idiomarina]AVJ55144.1 hypothetical protein C5610_01810 [Idiomarina sp. OT37-5b]RUO45326.1 hypothetical protein CWE23_04785 [Idiomarina aquatica]